MLVSDDTEGEDPKYLVMADDGKGGSVRIPSMLISAKNGLKLKDSIHENEQYDYDLGDGAKKDLDDDEDFTIKTPDSGLVENEESSSHQSNQVIIQA